MAEEGSRPVSYELVGNFKLPRSFSKERFLSAIAYKPQDDDIFLATYPRCGTTWTQQILYLIFHNGNPAENANVFLKSCPYMEMLGAESAVNASRPCALKVHLPFHLTPYSSKARYVYIARNPKDCCVSLYYFATRTVSVDLDLTFDKYFEDFINGEVPYGDYFDHLISWYDHRNDPNVLFLTFEEMKVDILSVIKRICSFFGGRYEEMISDAELMEKIIHYSSFEFMKKNVNENFKSVAVDTEYDKDLAGFKEVWAKRDRNVDSQFVRKGEIGGWRELFSMDQSRRMDEKMREKLKNTDLLQTWLDV